MTRARPGTKVTAGPANLKPLLPYYLALAEAFSSRGRHGEAAALLQQAQRDAGDAQEQVGGLLIDELVADANHEQVLLAGLDMADQAPHAARHALSHLRDNVRPAQLPEAATLMLERDWAALAANTQTPQQVRADILALVAELLQRHLRFQESADLLSALPAELAEDLRVQLLLGKAHVALRRWLPAQEVLTAAVGAISPLTRPELADEIRLTSAALHESLGQVSEALALLDPHASARPDTRVRCHALRALCLAQTGQPELAEEERVSAEALAPEAEAVLITGTWVLLGARNFGAAAERAAAGLRRHPESDELSFLRSQTKIAEGVDLANRERRVRRLVARLERADLTVLLDRTLRVRADTDVSLHYFLAIVQRAIGHDDEALISAGAAVARLEAETVTAGPSRLAMAARTLLAELLRYGDPLAAAAQYEAAGNDAFGLGDWNAAFELLSTADRIAALGDPGRWNLAEAYFLTSFTEAEEMGLSEIQLRRAVDTWDGAFAARLPDTDTGWAYISRARMEMRLARLARRSPEFALRALLYCECGLVLGAPASALVAVYAESTRALGLYAIGAEVAQLGLDAGPDEVPTLRSLLTSAANGGDLELYRAGLQRLERAAADTSWHTDAARLRLLEGDPAAAVDELAQVNDSDRVPLIAEWYELQAHARLGDTDGVSAAVSRAREHMDEAGTLTEQAALHLGVMLCFRLFFNEPDAAANLLEGMTSEDSWWNSVTLDAALTGLAGGNRPPGDTPGQTNEDAVREFLQRTRSFEDVGHLSTMLKELPAVIRGQSGGQIIEGLDAAVNRLVDTATVRLDQGGWPLTVEADLTSLIDRPWSPEHEPLARAAKLAIEVRHAMGDEDWRIAIQGLRSLLATDGLFPEAEQDLIRIASWAITRSISMGSDGLGDVVQALTEALPSLGGVRRRAAAVDLLELWLGDAHLHFQDLGGAQALYERAVSVVGERAARHVVAARLHVGTVLLERPAEGPGLEAVLKACAEAGAPISKVMLDAAAALVRSAADWQRLLDAWEVQSASLVASAAPEAAHDVALLLVEATAQAGWAWRGQGDLERAQALLRRSFEMQHDIAGPDDPEVLARRHNLAVVLAEQDRLADAEIELRDVIDRRTRGPGPDDETTLSARLDLGGMLIESGLPAEAEAEFRLVADARGRLLGEESMATWEARYGVAKALQLQGRLEDAERAYRDLLEAHRRLGAWPRGDTDVARFDLASVLAGLGRFAESAEEFRAVVADRVHLSEGDQLALAARFELAWNSYRAGELGAAETEYRAVIEAQGRELGEDDLATLRTRLELAWVLKAQERWAEAEAEIRAVALGRARVLGEDDPETLDAQVELVPVLSRLDRAADAEVELRAVAEARTRVLGPDDPATLATRFELAAVLRDLGRAEEADAMLGRRRRRLRQSSRAGRPRPM